MELSASYGLPMEIYACTVTRDFPPGSEEHGWFTARSPESLTAVFSHESTGREIAITGIWASDDGVILQKGAQHGVLVY